MAVKKKVMQKIKPGSMFAKIKASIARSSQGQKGVFYVKDGEKKKVRFLQDFEEGIQIIWHSKWVGDKAELDTPCLLFWGKECPFCGAAEVKTSEKYAWQVYDYDAKTIRIFCYKANNFSPIPQLAEIAQTFNTLLNRDLQVSRMGSSAKTSYSVITLDPTRFRFDAKPLSKKKFMALLADAFVTGELDDYPDAEDDTEYEEDEELEDDDENEDDEDTDDGEEEEEEESEEEESEYDDDGEEEEEEPAPRRRVTAKKAVPLRRAASKVLAKKKKVRR